MISEPYTLDPGFEADVVGYLITDRKFFGSVAEGLEPEAFPNKHAKLAVGLCMRYYKEYNVCPGDVKLFAQLLRKNCVEEGKVTYDTMMGCLEYVNEALDYMAPVDSVLTEFAEIVRQRVRDNALRAQLMDSNYEKLLDQLAQANSIGVADRSAGIGLTLRDEPEAPEGGIKKCPTGIIPLDYITKGGISVGQLFAFLGDTGDGKSLGLSQMAAANIREGHNVLVHASEMTEYEVRYRIISDLTNIPYEQLEDDVPGARDRAQIVLDRLTKACNWGTLSIKYTVPDEGTPQDTESFIKDFQKAVGALPDLVVVDYADRLHDGGKPGRTDYVVQGKVWQALEVLAKKYKCVIATASQAKALQKGQKWLDKNNFADSKRKGRFLNVGVSINWNGTKTEGGIHIFKGRKGLPVGRTLRIVPNFPCARISEISERVKAGMKPSLDRRKGDYGATMQFIDELAEPEDNPAMDGFV